MKKARNEAAVGMFVVIGFIILTLIVFFVSGVYFFRSGYSVSVMYDYVSILDRGAPVRMAGVRVGEVSDVTLMYDPVEQRTRVRVKLFIEKGVEIRENYLFQIQGTHILSEPHIEISPQPGNAPLLVDGVKLQGDDLTSIETLVEHANSIAANLDSIIGSLREAVADEETTKALKDIVLNLAELTKSLKIALSGSEEDMKEAIHNIQLSAASLNRVLESMDKGEGTAGQLLKSDELYQEIRAFVAEIKARPWRLLKKDKG